MSEPADHPKWLKLVAMFKEFATPKYFWLAFGLVVVVLTAAFGGMAGIPQDPVAAKTAPVKIEAHPFEFTFQSAYVSDTRPGSSRPTPGVRYLAFTGEVVAKYDRYVSSYTLLQALRFEADQLTMGGTRFAWDKMPPTCTRDGYGTSDPQPDVAFEVTCYVSQDASAPSPTSLRVHVRKQTLREDSLLGGLSWLDPEDVAIVTIEVRP